MGWGEGEGGGFEILHRNTLAHAHSFTSQPASHSVRQTKKSNILQEDSTLPGGWGIIPLHRVGGAGGGRSIRVRGLCLSSRVPHPHTYTNIHTSIHFSVDLMAIKPLSRINRFVQLTTVYLCICFFFFFFLMWVVRVFLYVN